MLPYSERLFAYVIITFIGLWYPGFIYDYMHVPETLESTYYITLHDNSLSLFNIKLRIVQ